MLFKLEGNFIAASMFVPLNLAWIYSSLGATDITLNYVYQSVEAMKGLPVFQARAHVILAKILALRGDHTKAMKIINASYELLESVAPDLFASALMWVIVGELKLEDGDLAGAMATVERLEHYAERSKGMWCMPDALLLRATILYESGSEKQAVEVLHEAKSESDRLGSHRSKLRIMAAMARHVLPAWSDEQVKMFKHEARALIEQIEAGIDNDELRSTFQQSRPVRSLLA